MDRFREKKDYSQWQSQHCNVHLLSLNSFLCNHVFIIKFSSRFHKRQHSVGSGISWFDQLLVLSAEANYYFFFWALVSLTLKGLIIVSVPKALLQMYMCMCVCARTQSCLTPCDPMDCSPPGSSTHGIFQTRILEWAAISSSRGSSWPKDPTHVSQVSHIGQ